MKRYITLFALCLLAAFVAAPQAHAQCNAGPGNPLTGTWTYHTEGASLFSTTPPVFFVYVSGGRFTATSGVDVHNNPVGLLSVIATTNRNLSMFRLGQSRGTYQINADCSGGSLVFMDGEANIQFDFWFAAGNTEMYWVTNELGVLATGVAKRI